MPLKIILVILSAVLVSFALPGGIEIPLLAWVSLVPFLFALEHASLRRALLLGFIFGFIHYGAGMWWLNNIESVVFFGWLAATLFWGAVHFPVFAFLVAATRRTPSYIWALTFAALWVVADFVIRDLVFAFPLFNIAESQYGSLRLIQIVDIGGIYLLSFIVLLVNASLFVVLKNLAQLRKATFPATWTLLLFATMIIFFATYAYGIISLRKESRISPNARIKILAIQPNFRVDDPKSKDVAKRIETLIRITREGLRTSSPERPDLVVWPEASITSWLFQETNGGAHLEILEPDYFTSVKRFQEEIDIPLLFGTYTYPHNFSLQKPFYYGTMVLISEEDMEWYNKTKPLFGPEYIPDVLSPLRKMANALGFAYKIPGEAPHVFTIDDTTSFATPMCSENSLGRLARSYVKSGALFLINPSNDADLKSKRAIHEHAVLNRFRAIETRTPVLEAANVGETALTLETGRVAMRLPYFQEGWAMVDIPIHVSRKHTIYERFGDALVVLLALFALTQYRHVRTRFFSILRGETIHP